MAHLDFHGNEDVQKPANRDRNRQQTLTIGRGFLGQVLRVLQVGRNVIVHVLFVAPIQSDDQTDESTEQQIVLSGQIAFALQINIVFIAAVG